MCESIKSRADHRKGATSGHGISCMCCKPKSKNDKVKTLQTPCGHSAPPDLYNALENSAKTSFSSESSVNNSALEKKKSFNLTFYGADIVKLENSQTNDNLLKTHLRKLSKDGNRLIRNLNNFYSNIDATPELNESFKQVNNTANSICAALRALPEIVLKSNECSYHPSKKAKHRATPDSQSKPNKATSSKSNPTGNILSSIIFEMNKCKKWEDKNTTESSEVETIVPLTQNELDSLINDKKVDGIPEPNTMVFGSQADNDKNVTSLSTDQGLVTLQQATKELEKISDCLKTLKK